MPNTADRLGDTLECWTTLASLATVVHRMRVGTIVAGNTYRHPAVLAKMAANVDVVTGGRLICGMGAPGGRRTSTRPTGSRSTRSGSGWPGSTRLARC
jgi:alkanesulfonate monooxygenase SsuD/methylene tetrahydromethanopterin reductase-like flavin-dependent oxidoreductase (luciferase family)